MKSIGEKGHHKIPADELKLLILDLCNEDFLTKIQLATLLKKNPNHLRQEYIKPLVDEGKLELKFPESKSRPGQAYKSVKS